MERSALAQPLAESAGTAAPQPASLTANALMYYQLQPDAAGSGYAAVRVLNAPEADSHDDSFLLYTADDWTPAESVLQEVARMSDQRPELNCFLISLAPRSLDNGLYSSLQLFQQLQAQHVWRQNNFAVILRAGMAMRAAPLRTLQDAMLAALLSSQSAGLINASGEPATLTENPPLTYQQFMAEYETLTRLSHYIPERNRYRQIYLRTGLLQLVRQELNQASHFSDNVRYAISYFADRFPAQGPMEKLMLKQPDIYFSLMKMRKSR